MKKRIMSIIVLTLICISMIYTGVQAEEQWLWPTLASRMNTSYITQKYHSDHQALDIGGASVEVSRETNFGTIPIYASKSGTIVDRYDGCKDCRSAKAKYCKHGKSCGNYVIIDHGNGVYSRYIHLTPNDVAQKGKVKQGDVIGYMGSTGGSHGIHLHFDIWTGGTGASDGIVKNGSKINVNPKNVYSNGAITYITTSNPSSGNVHYKHDFKHDVANEKCYCGETFARQYEAINETYTVSTATSLKSKPYADYGERVAKLNTGDKVYVKKTFENVYGNVWCEAEVGNKKGYIYFGSLKGESSLKINLTSYPTSIKVGSSFGLRGEITSNYAIKKIVGYIQQGNTVIQSSNDTPNSKSVDVKNANLNKNLSFGKLSAGNYSLYVEVVDASGKVVSVNKNFNVYEEKKNDESTLKINLERYPVSINLGSTFSVRGNIASNYSISKVKGYIYDANGSMVQSTTDTPNSKYMEIRPANLNQKLIFGKLSSGSYTMKIEAVDASGKVVTATKTFTVKGSDGTGGTPSVTPSTSSNTSIKFELESVPKGNLKYGKSFSLKGWFRSDSAIVEARAYMLDSNKNIVMQSDKASSTTSNYKIQGFKLDTAMKFGELKPGGYYLKFFVRDANGDTATWISDMFYIVK